MRETLDYTITQTKGTNALGKVLSAGKNVFSLVESYITGQLP